MKISKKIYTLLIIAIFSSSQILSTSLNIPQKMIVNTLVTDILENPCEITPNYQKQENARLTQALLGEHILVIEEKGPWLKAELLEQKKFNVNLKLSNITGWIKKTEATIVKDFPIYNLVTRNKKCFVYSDISKNKNLLILPAGIKLMAEKIHINWWKIFLPDGTIGTIEAKDICELSLNALEDENTLRKKITETAKQFISDPYLWKGRSCYNPEIQNTLTSVDCSGLVELVYRANGFTIPRYPNCQYLKSNKISASELKEGDVIFWATPSDPNKIVHTMLYIGNGTILESPRLNTQVREATLENRVNHHVKIGRIISYYGSFLNSVALIQELRIAAITNQYAEIKNDASAESIKQPYHQTPNPQRINLTKPLNRPRIFINSQTQKFSQKNYQHKKNCW